MRLDDLKISTKVLAPALILAALALAVAIAGAWSTNTVRQTARVLVEERAPLELASARFNRRLQAMGYATYRTIAYSSRQAEGRAAGVELDRNYAESKALLDEMVKVEPAANAKVKDFRLRLDKVYAAAREGADLGLQDANDAAILVIAEINPSIAQLSADVSTFTNGHNDQTRVLAAQAEKRAIASVTTMLAVGTVAAGLGLVLAIWIGRNKIARPLINLSKTMEVLAQGSVEVDVVGGQRRDEVGAMARSVQVFKDNALALRTAEAAQQRAAAETEAERRRNEQVREAAAKEQAFVMEIIATGLNRLAEGDLTYRVDADFPADYKRLQSDFNGAISQLEEAMRTIVHAANGIGAGSDEIASAADDLSRRSEQQAASLEETAAALDEITATVRRSSVGAQEAARVVGSTRSDAERTSAVVKGAVDAMQQIEKSSSEISQIIGVIDEIAFQTNLLALNAGVEAARAGDAGKGFAVVAQEVRALAQRSAEAAKEIKTLISTSSHQVEQGVSMVGQTGEALQAIVSKVGEIDALVSEIAAGAGEQATGLNQVNAAVNQMDQTVQQNAAMVEQSTAASHSLKGEATGLMAMISRFNVSGAEARRASAGGGWVRRSAPMASAPISRPAAKPAVSLAAADSRPGANPVRSAQAKLAAFASSAPAATSDDWEEF
ncbi:methyl-accepting chemotaxis protein [Caulobacter zeae]|uniref:Methyl-accepting chemotaxis protein n=1 Tax=Caulobacter zeae TaxID=2055137 RepID=A0A2N5DRI4_9CAUL|nr:methyl-accepting chemotaxis protein [Caulobacter zeae]PLR28661.1 methyl-accepting chemotaxis protein [Caulobacter zeae]